MPEKRSFDALPPKLPAKVSHGAGWLAHGFHRWRTVLRIHHALVHLTEGRSVTDTAMACGWSNPASFIEAFHGVVGQTPGSYRAGLVEK